jgi:hypothetical protein
MKVLIEEDELQGLLEANEKLTALEDGGVENWEWYDNAVENYSQDNVDFIVRQYKWDTENATKQQESRGYRKSSLQR